MSDWDEGDNVVTGVGDTLLGARPPEDDEKSTDGGANEAADHGKPVEDSERTPSKERQLDRVTGPVSAVEGDGEVADTRAASGRELALDGGFCDEIGRNNGTAKAAESRV